MVAIYFVAIHEIVIHITPLLFLHFIKLIRLTADNSTTVRMKGLTTDGATIIARQENKAGRNLTGLRWPANGRSKLLESFVIHGRRDKRCPDRAGSNGIDTNAASYILI